MSDYVVHRLSINSIPFNYPSDQVGQTIEELFKVLVLKEQVHNSYCKASKRKAELDSILSKRETTITIMVAKDKSRFSNETERRAGIKELISVDKESQKALTELDQIKIDLNTMLFTDKQYDKVYELGKFVLSNFSLSKV